MPRFQRKLILLLILVNFMIFFLILLKLQSTAPAYYQEEEQVPEEEKPSVNQIQIHIQLSPFGKKQDQEEEEKARKELQKVSHSHYLTFYTGFTHRTETFEYCFFSI